MSRVASLRLQLIDAVSGPSRDIIKNSKALDATLGRLGKAGVPEAKKLGRQLDWLKQKTETVFRFNSERRELAQLYKSMRDARSNVARIGETLAIAAKEPKKFGAAIRVLKQDLNLAQRQLTSTSSAFKQQQGAVAAAERALRMYSINGARAAAGAQKGLRDQIAATIREIRRLDQESRKTPPTVPPKGGGGSGGGGGGIGRDIGIAAGAYGAYQARNAAQRGFGLAIDFSQAADYQQALGGFNDEERSRLNKQAERIGGDTRFSNADVVLAQTQILQGGIRDPKAIMNLTEQVKDYALAMGVTLEEGAETIRGAALSKRVNLGDPKAVKNFVDFMVWMAKNAGMSDEDVRQFMKYGGASTTGAGLPDTHAAAIAMILRRSGVRGDEAGVFARSASSKLVAPTNKGRNALAAMGIDYNKFTTMPDALNSKGIGILMKNNFGKRLTPEMEEQVNDLLENGEYNDPETGEARPVGSDAGEFAVRLRDILAPLFGTNKKGQMAAADEKALAKALVDYHKASVESVDVVGLLTAIMSSNPSLANLNAFFTDRQGGRANMIAQQWPLFQEFLKLMQAPPENVAANIGEKANSGFYGDWTKMVGTVETALTRTVQDWEFALRPMITWTDKLVDSFINADPAVRKMIEAFLAATAVFGAYVAYSGGKSLLKDLLGNGKGGAGGAGAPGGAGSPAKGGARGGLGLWGMLFGVGGAAAIAGGLPDNKEDLLEQLRSNYAVTDGWNKWLEEKFGSPNTWFGRGGAGGPSGGNDSALGDLDKITASWPEAARKAMDDYGIALQEGGAGAEAKAAAIAQQIVTELSVTGRPEVDTTALERALGIARQVAAAVRGTTVGGGVSTPANSAPWGGPRAKGGPLRAGHAYLFGEEGPEVGVFGRNGHMTSNKDVTSMLAGGGGRGLTVHAPVNLKIVVQGSGNLPEDVKRAATRAAEQVVADMARQLDSGLSRMEDTSFGNLRYGGD